MYNGSMLIKNKELNNMTNIQLIQQLEAERSRLLGLSRRQQIQILQQTSHGEFRAVIRDIENTIRTLYITA